VTQLEQSERVTNAEYGTERARVGFSRRLLERLEAAHAPTESALPLAVFRILFCGLLLREIWQLFEFRELLFDAVPHRVPSRVPIGPALLIWAVAVALLLVGYKPKIAAAINYVFSVLLIGFAADRHGFQGHWDCFVLYAAVLFLLCPSCRTLSLDAALKRRAARQRGTSPPSSGIGKIYYAILALGIGTMYLDSCAYKLASPMYRSGLGLWAPASLPYNLHNAAAGLLDYELVALASGYFAIAFELSFCVLIWSRRVRPYLVGIGIVFHLTVLYFFPLWSFSLMVVVFYLALLPSTFYEWAAVSVRRLFASAKLAPSAASVEPAHPIAATPRLERLAVNGWLALWLFSFAVLVLGSPLGKLSGSKAVASQLRRVAAAYRRALYPWTGFSQHAVFVDAHFRDYTNQIRLVYRDANGSRELPLIATEGTCLDWNLDRFWVMWSFRTSRPSLPLAQADDNLRRFALHWSHEEKANLRRGRIEILARPVAVSLDEWQPGLLRRNLAAPWRAAGEIVERAQGVVVSWKHRPSNAATLAQVIQFEPQLNDASTVSGLSPERPPPEFAPARRE
jgi:hypothetical protein